LWPYGTSPDYLGGHNTASDYNLFYSTNSIAFNQYYTSFTFAAFTATTNQDTHSFFSSPIFIGGASPATIADYALAPDSPGKHAASDSTDMGADISRVGIGVSSTGNAIPRAPMGLHLR
jgi:hypothetical protein